MGHSDAYDYRRLQMVETLRLGGISDSRVLEAMTRVPREMEIFYGELLNSDATPTSAMRVAQLKIRENPRWSDPYFWAAFIVQGDWQN